MGHKCVCACVCVHVCVRVCACVRVCGSRCENMRFCSSRFVLLSIHYSLTHSSLTLFHVWSTLNSCVIFRATDLHTELVALDEMQSNKSLADIFLKWVCVCAFVRLFV